MSMQSTKKRINTLDLFSEKPLALTAKFANLIFDNNGNSHFIEVLMIIFEYAQLISQAILLYPSFYDSSPDDNTFQRYIIYAAKMINPSYLLIFQGPKDTTTTMSVLSIIISWLILKYCIIAYICLFISQNKKPNSLAFHIFCWSLKLQTRVIYYFASSFFFRSIIENKENGFVFLGIGKIGDFVVCAIFICIEFYLSISSRIGFHCILPTRSFLSSKDNLIEIINFLQKFIIQILQLFLSQTSIASKWILTLINLGLAILRGFKFFATIPLYKVKSLFLEGILIGIVTSLNLASLMYLILSSEGTKSFIIIWIVLALFSVKISIGFLKMIVFKVLTQNNLNSPELLVHKIEIFKQFLKQQKLPSQTCDQNNWFYLLIAGIKENLTQGFCVSQETKPDFSTKVSMNNIFISHLENLLAKYPKNNLVKLYLGFAYAKKAKAYAKAIILINEVIHTSKFKLAVNASYLLFQIEKILRSNYIGDTSRINLLTYVQHNIGLEKLQKAIVKQIDKQSLVCEELLNTSSNLSKIFNTAQSSHKYKQEANRRIKLLLNTMPEHCVRPLVLFAYYNLIINQSPYDFQKLIEIFHLKNQKYQKYFQAERLCEENVYQDNCALFVVSGQKNEAGKVISCNTSVERVCGGDPHWYIGSKVYHRICSPSLRPMSESFYKSLSEPESLALFNQTIRTYLYNKEGYIYECDFYVNLYPSISRGFFTALIIKPAVEKKDFILVRENGEIEGASKKVCKRLGIFLEDNSAKKIHINQVSQELAQVSEAINTVSFVDQDKIKYDINITIKNQIKQPGSPSHKLQPVFVEEARRLYSLYTERGNEIDLTPIQQDLQSPCRKNQKPLKKYNYFCKASNLVYDSFVLRLFSLEEVENDNESDFIDDGVLGAFGDHPEVKSQISDGDDEFQNLKIDEEKDRGWTDLPRLDSKQLLRPDPSKNKTSLVTTESTNIACESPTKPQSSQDLHKIVIKRHQNPKKSKRLQSPETDPSKSDNPNLAQDTQRNTLIPVKVVESIANSSSSRKSSTQRTSRAIQLALEAKQYTKNYKRTISTFTVLMIAILIIITLLFLNLDRTIEDLRLKKNIMVSSQRRGYFIINIQTSTRSIFDLLTGAVLPSDFDALGRSVPGFIVIIGGYAQLIYQANQNVLEWVNLLDTESKKPFFEQNIRMTYPNDETQKMTSFQATDSVIQEILNLLQLAAKGKSISTEAFNALSYNLVNDFLLKNREIAVETLESVQSQADTVLMLNFMYMVVICGCMLFLAGLLFTMIWLQYGRKRNNLNHLTKISHFGIQAVLNNSLVFKESLLKDEDFRLQDFYSFSDSKSTKLTQQRSSSTKIHSHSTATSSTQNEFLLYGVKSTILILLLSVLLLVAVTFTPHSMKFLNKKIIQINYLGRLANRVSRTTIATIELPIGNGTTIIEKMKSDVAIESFIKELAGLRKELLTHFMDNDITNDYEISQVIYGNACNVLGDLEALFCNILSKKTTNSSMTQLLGSFETLIIQRTRDYQNSDKSVQSLKKNRLFNYDLLLSSKRVIADSAILVADMLDGDFEDKLISLDSQRQLGLNISVIGLLAMTLMLWIFVLNPIKEIDNEFKKILQIFPAKLILSNFSLKLFLLENASIDANLIKNWG